MSEVDRYPLTVRPLEPDEGGGYLCEFPDLPACMGDGATPEEAIADGKEALRASLQTLRELGRDVPAPSAPSGEWRRMNPLDVWKEINQHIRHWESLLFDSTKNYFTVLSLSIGAAGASAAWSTVVLEQRIIVVVVFLILAVILSLFARSTVKSQQVYLKGFYDRGKEIESENPNLMMRSKQDKTARMSESGKTVDLIRRGFLSIAILTTILLVLIVVATFSIEIQRVHFYPTQS